MKCATCDNEARYRVSVTTMDGQVVVTRGYCADCVHEVAVQGRGAALDLPGE